MSRRTPRCHPLYTDDCSVSGNASEIRPFYLFQSLGKEVYAFSLDPVGRNIPCVDGYTAWLFREKISEPMLVPGSDLEEFREVLRHLDARGFYLFEGYEMRPAQPVIATFTLPNAALQQIDLRSPISDGKNACQVRTRIAPRVLGKLNKLT